MSSTTVFYADPINGKTTSASVFVLPAGKSDVSGLTGEPLAPSILNPILATATAAKPSAQEASKSSPTQPLSTAVNGASSVATSVPQVTSTNGDVVSSASVSNTGAAVTTSSAVYVEVKKSDYDNYKAHYCKNCLAAGPIAGIAIGVALVAALLAFLVALLLFKKRKRSKRDLHGYPEQTDLNGKSNGFAMGAIPGKDTSTHTWDEGLPQAADDKTVAMRTESMLDQVQLFVENFVQNEANPQIRVSAADLTPLDSPSLSKPLAATMSTNIDTLPLVKHAMINYTISLITINTNPEQSLLPPEIAIIPYSVGISSTKVNTDINPLLSRWRKLTSYLRSQGAESVSYSTQRDAKISSANATQLRAFAPWLKPRYTAKDQVNSLTTILREAASLGTFIASQPSDLQFRWPSANEAGSGRIAVTPSLVKVTDELGRSLRQPQIVVAPKFAKVRGEV